MTDKELRRLKKSELLEILFYLQKDNETLRQESDELRQQMANIAAASRVSDDDIERIARAVKYELKGGGPGSTANKKKK